MVSARRSPDRAGLERLAYAQEGYFTAAQAQEHGFSHQLLAHHARSGWIERVRRGLYRIRTYPASTHEPIRAAWLALRPDRAIVSHESALELLDLADVLPNQVHLTVPREVRGLRPPKGVLLHTTKTRPEPGEIVTREGMPVSAPHRAIAEAAQFGTQPDQVEAAVERALVRGLTTTRQLRDATANRGARVRSLIERGIDRAGRR